MVDLGGLGVKYSQNTFKFFQRNKNWEKYYMVDDNSRISERWEI